MPTATTLLSYLFQPGLKENLSWNTQVMTSNNGYEQRMKLRNAPRQLFTFNIAIPRGEIGRLDTLLFGNRGGEFFVPVSSECRKLIAPTSAASPNIDVSTEFADFRVGGEAIIYNSPRDFELVVIQSLTTNQIVATANISKVYGITALVMPVRTAILINNPKRLTTGDTQRLQTNFLVKDNIALTTSPSPVQYKNFDVFLDQPLTLNNFASDVYSNRVDSVDFGTGLSNEFAPWIKTKTQRSFGLQFDSQEEVWNYRLWLHRRQGKLLPFWMPTFESDFTLLTTGAITNQLLVVNDGQDTLSDGRNDLAILTAAGWILREILSIVPAGADLLVTLDSVVSIDASEVELISFLGRKRLTSDKLDIIWDGNDTGHASVPITEINDFAAINTVVPIDGIHCEFTPSIGVRFTQSVVEVLHNV